MKDRFKIIWNMVGVEQSLDKIIMKDIGVIIYHMDLVE